MTLFASLTFLAHFPIQCVNTRWTRPLPCSIAGQIITYIHISIHFQIKKKCTELQLVCIHLVLFVIPCSTLDSVRRTCVSLSVVGNAHALRRVAVARGSRWSPYPCVALATWSTPSTRGARRTWGSCSWLSWWPCRWGSEAVSEIVPDKGDADFTLLPILGQTWATSGATGVLQDFFVVAWQ